MKQKIEKYFVNTFGFRIPRTKSEIEANFKRKALLKQFNGRMKQLNTKDLDDMTYK